MRRWHHQLTHLHININCSRYVPLKNHKIQNFISSLIFIRFTSNFHCSVQFFLLFLLNFNNFNLDWISPLRLDTEMILILPGSMVEVCVICVVLKSSGRVASVGDLPVILVLPNITIVGCQRRADESNGLLIIKILGRKISIVASCAGSECSILVLID